MESTTEAPRVKKYRRTHATDLKRISNDMIRLLERVKQKKYTDREIEEAIHKARVLERRKQIALEKLDTEWDKLVVFEAKKIQEKKKRISVYLSIRNMLIQLLP